MDHSQTPPIVLTIAGSDSGGGAGIQADLKTFHAFGAFGTSVITAVTAQNTRGVTAIHAIPLEVVGAQLDAVIGDLPPAALKTGMLGTAPLVEYVATRIRNAALNNLVVDPVMVSTSGHRLLEEPAEASIQSQLLPLAVLVTPNIPEAEILAGRSIEGPKDMREAAHALVDAGAGAALVKGGHLEGDRVIDLFWDGQVERTWSRERIRTQNTHGTGCTLSAAIAASLGLGQPLEEAVDAALGFVERAIRSAPGFGSGHGPLNHFAPVSSDA